MSDVVVPERGAKQGKEKPKVVGTLSTVEELQDIRKDIRHSFITIYYHASLVLSLSLSLR